MAKGKKGAKSAAGGVGAGGNGFSTIEVDPCRVRFAHSRIKPVFSGCGRTIDQTLAEIRAGKTVPSELPMITVILGPIDATDGQQWFYSLNNRRLFVFKVCREEGLLGPRGLVRVRARAMKEHERDRYTLERCALQAKFLFAPKTTSSREEPAPNADEHRKEAGEEVVAEEEEDEERVCSSSRAGEEEGPRERNVLPRTGNVLP